MSDNLLVVVEKEVRVAATGDSLGDAVNDSFAKLRKQVYREIPGPIAQMETVGYRVERCKVREHTERFLGVLWPRQKQAVEVKVLIKVLVRYIRIEGLAEREG